MNITADMAKAAVSSRVVKAFTRRHGHGTRRSVVYRQLRPHQLRDLLALAYLDGVRDAQVARGDDGA